MKSLKRIWYSHKLTSLECTYKSSIVAKKVLADGSQSPKYLPMTAVELVWKKRGKENEIQKYD